MNDIEFDLHGEAFHADPFDTLARLRRQAPCWYDARLGAWVLTRHDDIARVLRDDACFSAARVAQFGRGAPAEAEPKLQAVNQALERWLLFSDRPLHTTLRQRLGRAFGSGQRARMEQATRQAVTQALAALHAHGPAAEVDLVRDFAYPVPSRVLATLLGIPDADIERFKGWTTDLFALIGAGIADAAAVDAGHRGVTELGRYVRDLLDDRRRHPRDDVLGHLAHRGQQTDAEAAVDVSDDDLVGLLMTMIVAGHETTTHLLANALRGLHGDARALAAVRARGGVDDAVVDELIRHDGAVFSLVRRARCDVVLAGRTVREGECVFSMLHAGNRDPAAFPDPDRLRFDRPPRPAHLGLGLGIHACMGAAMARHVTRQALNGFLRAFPRAAVLPVTRWAHNLSIRGPLALPCRLAGLAQPRPATALPDLAENRPRRHAGAQRVHNVAEVRAAVREARDRGEPLYPVSTGRNWGLGSRSPVQDGCRLLDLAGLDRIRRLDLQQGIAVVEPGVTQGALADRLADAPFMLNVTTSCRSTSVVGNLLDRGQGVLRLRSADLRGLEVVLGDGTLATTGLLRPDGGVTGPDATELFCQSNFGVVTAAAIALLPRPERTAFVYAVYERRALAEVVDTLARLHRDRVIEHLFYLGEMTLGAAPGDSFTVLGPLLGVADLVAPALHRTEAALGRIAGCTMLRSGAADALAPGDPLYERGQHFLGVPSCGPLRRRFGVDTCDLDSAAARGWSVLQVRVPFHGPTVLEAVDRLDASARACRLSVQAHFSTVSGQALNLMTMIGFARDACGIADMRQLRDELRARWAGCGFVPSREGIDALQHRASAAMGIDPAWRLLKAALDPQGVIAPGRYVPAATAGAQPGANVQDAAASGADHGNAMPAT